MATQLETLGPLERRLSLSLALADIEREVGERLRKIARTAKMPGFRPGKVPLTMVQQSYGAGVHSEVLSEAVSRAFSEAVSEHQLRVAGDPSIDRAESAPEGAMGFVATFEVYPDVVLGEIASLSVERPSCPVSDAEVDRTLEILRKQRASWTPVERAAADGDKIKLDFQGTLDGVAFEGGTAEDFEFELGQGRMLADFETGVRGAAPGDKRAFDVAFPAEYGAPNLSGKTARFEVVIKGISEPVLPALDNEFAQGFGVADGTIESMRAGVRANLEREVRQRLVARTKQAVMEVLPTVATLEIPKALVRSESQALAERARQDLKSRGVDVDKMPIPTETFASQAESRVRVGLILAELVRLHSLQAKPEQIRKQIEEFAASYEKPAEVVRYYFSDRNRLAEVEAIVVEQNVVDWVLANASVSDKALAFDDLMAA